ncbi:MAG: HAD hydrolase-like protein, partial [Clostridia bacterium]|nr:HAD hydrolase-like protein [Clostridia bacterium]
VNAGVDTICVLSGESTMEDIENSEIKPTYIRQDIKEILKELQV